MKRSKYKNGNVINGILLIKKIIGSKYSKAIFECPYCKQEYETRISHVLSGGSTSCGCTYMGRPKHNNTTLAGYRSPTYKTWVCMMRRCYGDDPKDNKSYKEKGIVVCERWHDFNNFIADVGERPKGKTLDRWPNKDGNYGPTNFRWATPTEQQRNTSINLIVTYNGVTKTLQEFCEDLGLEYHRMRNRIFLKDVPVHMAFTEPKRSAKICSFIKAKRESKVA